MQLIKASTPFDVVLSRKNKETKEVDLSEFLRSEGVQTRAVGFALRAQRAAGRVERKRAAGGQGLKTEGREEKSGRHVG